MRVYWHGIQYLQRVEGIKRGALFGMISTCESGGVYWTDTGSSDFIWELIIGRTGRLFQTILLSFGGAYLREEHYLNLFILTEIVIVVVCIAMLFRERIERILRILHIMCWQAGQFDPYSNIATRCYLLVMLQSRWVIIWRRWWIKIQCRSTLNSVFCT